MNQLERQFPTLITGVMLSVIVFFIALLLMEYRQNVALIDENRRLMQSALRSELRRELINSQPDQALPPAAQDYSWIKRLPEFAYFQNGQQLFPWVGLVKDNTPRNWSTVWQQIDALEAGSMVDSGRIELLKTIDSALRGGDDKEISRAFSDYLANLRALVLSPEQEVAFALKLIELGVDQHWSAPFIEAILLTGGSAERPLARPVADWLFRHSDSFTREDMQFVIDRIGDHIEQINGTLYHLLDYWEWFNRPALPAPQVMLSEPNLINGSWLIVPLANQSSLAYRVNLPDVVEQIRQRSQRMGMLQSTDMLNALPVAGTQPLSELRVDVVSERLLQQLKYQRWYFLFKLLVACLSLLFLLLMMRAIANGQRKRQEYLGLKEDFVRMVSHELKTPLAGIRAMAETLRKRLLRSLPVADYPERIVNETDNLTHMVDNILSFNRLQSGAVILNQQTTGLAKLVDSVVVNVCVLASKKYSVENCVPHDFDVNVDVELFSIVLKNLLVNAGLYNDNETIEITFELQGSTLIMRDNGIGIDQQAWDRVFEAFYRLAQETRQSGAGLGLSLCRKIMQLHKGDLRLLESSKSGSTWEVQLGL